MSAGKEVPPAGTVGEPAPPPRRRYRKRKAALRIVTWFGVVLLVLLAAAYLALQTRWAKDEITAFALTTLSDKLGRDVTFTGLDYEIAGLDSISVRIRDVVIPGPDPGSRPVLTADEVRLQLSLFGIPYLQPSRLDLEQIEVDRPDGYLELRADGTTNLPEIQSSGRRSPVEVQIGRLLVRDGMIEVDERRLPLEFDARDVIARATGGDPYTFQVRSQRIRLGIQEADPMPGGIALIGTYTAGRLTLERIGLQGDRLAASGHGLIRWGTGDEEETGLLSDPGDPAEDEVADTVIELTLDARADTTLLNELGWLDSDIDGRVRYEGEIGWTPAGLTYDGVVTSDRLTYFERSFTGVRAGLEGSGSRVVVDLERAGHAGGTFAGTLDLVLADADPDAGGPRGDLDLRIESVDLARVLDPFDLPVQGLSGRVSGELGYRFPLTDTLNGDGRGVLRLTGATTARSGDMPLSGRLPLSIRDGVLRIDEGRLTAPGHVVTADGSYDIDGGTGRIDYRVETEDLAALAALLPAEPGQDTYYPSAGTGTLEGTADIEPDTFSTDVSFDLAGVTLGPERIDVGALDGSLTFTPGRVTDLVARAREGGGTLEVTGEAGAPGALDLQVAFNEWPARTVDPFLPPDFAYHGEGDVTGRLRVTGVAEDPAVTGRLTAAPFTLEVAATPPVSGPEPSAGTPGGTIAFDTIEAEIDYAVGVFESLDVLGTRGGGRIAVTGRADLAGPLDLAVDLTEWPSRTLDPFLPDDFPYAFAGDVTGRLAVTGSIDDPALAGSLRAADFLLASSEVGLDGATRFDTVEATVDYRSGRFDSLDVEATSGERRLAVTGSADLAGPLDLTVDLTDWSTDTLAALSPSLGNLAVRGDVTGRLRVGGTIERPALDGRLTSGPIEIAGFLLDGIEASFDSADGRINLRDTRVTTPAGVLQADGWIDPATGTFDIQARGDDLDLSREPFDSRLAADVEGLVTFRADLQGSFESPQGRVTLAGRELSVDDRPLGQGGVARLDLDLEGDRLRLDGSLLGLLEFEGGGRFDRQRVDVTLDVSSEAVPALLDLALEGDPPPFTGHFGGTLRVTGALADPTTLAADLNLTEVRLHHEGRTIRNLEPVDVGVTAEEVTLRSVFVGVEDTDSELFLGGTIGLGENGPLRLQTQARLGAEWAELLLPGVEIEGTLEALATVGGTVAAPRVNGQGQFRDGQVILPDFPHALENANALAFFNPGQVILDSFRGDLAGGRVQASGTVDLPRPAAPGRAARDFGYRLQAQVRDVSMRYPEGFLIRGDAEMTLLTVRGGQELAGVVRLERAFYVRDVPTGAAELIRGFLQRERLEAGETDELLSTTQLAIAVEGPGALRVRNNLADLEGDIDLVVRGTLARPVVFGQVDLVPGGELVFQDNEYEVERGRLTFANPVRLDPIIDVVASTEISDYDLTLSVSGTLERLRTTFQTDPPLSDLEALSLVATGSVGGTGEFDAASFLYGQAASTVSKRFNTLFGFDKFRLNPSTTEGGAVAVGVSVEKRLGNDLFVAYTTGGGDTQDELLQLGWEITDNITLLFTQEGDDSLAVDIKVEKQF
jgi:autotransporter translocation and assembly factor TamB